MSSSDGICLHAEIGGGDALLLTERPINFVQYDLSAQLDNDVPSCILAFAVQLNELARALGAACQKRGRVGTDPRVGFSLVAAQRTCQKLGKLGYNGDRLLDSSMLSKAVEKLDKFARALDAAKGMSLKAQQEQFLKLQSERTSLVAVAETPGGVSRILKQIIGNDDVAQLGVEFINLMSSSASKLGPPITVPAKVSKQLVFMSLNALLIFFGVLFDEYSVAFPRNLSFYYHACNVWTALLPGFVLQSGRTTPGLQRLIGAKILALPNVDDLANGQTMQTVFVECGATLVEMARNHGLLQQQSLDKTARTGAEQRDQFLYSQAEFTSRVCVKQIDDTAVSGIAFSSFRRMFNGLVRRAKETFENYKMYSFKGTRQQLETLFEGLVRHTIEPYFNAKFSDNNADNVKKNLSGVATLKDVVAYASTYDALDDQVGGVANATVMKFSRATLSHTGQATSALVLLYLATLVDDIGRFQYCLREVIDNMYMAAHAYQLRRHYLRDATTATKKPLIPQRTPPAPPTKNPATVYDVLPPNPVIVYGPLPANPRTTDSPPTSEYQQIDPALLKPEPKAIAP
jgi:hypothetical protein